MTAPTREDVERRGRRLGGGKVRFWFVKVRGVMLRFWGVCGIITVGMLCGGRAGIPQSRYARQPPLTRGPKGRPMTAPTRGGMSRAPSPTGRGWHVVRGGWRKMEKIDFMEEWLMKRKIVSLTVALAMVFSMTSAFSLNAHAAEFTGSGGAGSAENPYIIANLSDLEELSTYAYENDAEGEYFELTADIDMSGTYGEGKSGGEEGNGSWTPIGDTSPNRFKGTFDGNGHTVKGLYIGSSYNFCIGLFGAVGEGGTVKNLGVSGTIDDSVDDFLSAIGGIAGANYGTIQNCYSSVTIIGSTTIGGIAGMNDSGTIENCYNTGNITSSSSEEFDGTGGIAGINSATIQNCYNTGTINGSSNVGSIVGNLNGTATNCYYLTNTADAGVGKTDEYSEDTTTAKNADEFKSLASSLNGGSGSAWEDSSFLERPILTAAPEGGDGTADMPYTIPDKATLEKIRDYINGGGGSGEHFKLTADINLEGSDTSRWTPIGTESNKFQGTFDGDGHKISGLYINTGENYQGLFGYIAEAGTVKNLGVEGSVTAGDNSGGIAGQNKGTIICSYNGANIICTSSAASSGGIAGSNSGKIENCYNSGSIGGTLYISISAGSIGDSRYIGGIAGLNTAQIENCYNTSVITDHSSSFSYSGAIAGQNGSAATVKNCYYLEKDGLKGIGTSESGGTVEKTESKTEDEFKSGAVTWLLQKGQDAPDTQVWGQNLGEEADTYPVLTSAAGAKVLKVTFSTKDKAEYDAKYTNPNGKVTLPSEPTKDNYTFKNWSKTENAGGETFDENTTVTEDMTVYAVGRDHFGGDSDITLTETYGYEEAITADLDTYMDYANESVEAEGKFTYEVSEQGDTDASISENTLTVQPGLNAGEHTITITAKEKEPQYSLMNVDSYGTDNVTLTVKVSIAKAEPSATVTAKDLTYTGNEQELVTGETEDGTIQYATSENGEYSVDIPKGKDADTYEVWYKVVGDSNHNNTEPKQVEGVEIKKAASSVESAPTAKDLKYTGEALELVTAGKTSDGEMQYSKDNESYSSEIPTETDAGTYSVWYKVKGDKNHKDTEPVEIQNIKIEKAEPSAVVTVNDLTFTGEAQALVTGETEDGTLKYATEQGGEYSADIPTGTEAKDYEVWYMVEGDGNHNDSEPQKVDVTIKKADSSVTSDGGEVIYGDTLTLTATVEKSPSRTLSISAAVDTVDFYIGETSLGSETVSYAGPFSDSGTATLTITADKTFEIGANTIRAEYGGSVNLNGSENNSITVTMNKKPLTYDVTAADREYNQTTLVDVTLTPTNNDEDNVTLTAVGNVAAADVDSYETVNLTEIEIGGEDAGYYSADSSADNVNLSEAVNITQANGSAAVTMNDYKCGDDSVQPVPSSDTNGTENVTYTYSVKDADDYGEEKPTAAGEPTEGTEYTVKAVFAETRNYKSVTVTDDFKVTHNWDEWTITDEPTQSEKGAAERNCLSEDNASPDTAEVAELSDGTVWSKGKYVPPTPESNGSQEYKSEYGVVTEIIPKLVVTELRIVSEPTVTAVTEGMTLDVSGLKVEAVYSDDSTADVTSECKLSYDTSEVGAKRVTVEYGGKTAEFGITVMAKELTGIVITKKPDKRLYSKGDSLDTAGMVVTAMYNNGTETQVTEYSVQGYSAQTVGTQTVTVSYGGFTAEFTVTVEEVTAPTGTVSTPVIETSGYYGGKTVTLTCASAEAKIYYTTDGSVPTEASNPYAEPFKVTAATVVKAIAVKDGMEQSRVASGKISVAAAATPTLSVNGGEVEAGAVVTLQSETSGAEIYYTTDGSVPSSENGALCNGSIVITDNVTVKAIAVKEGYASSEVCEASYTVKEREPNTANLSVGSASGKAGDTVYVPIYITAGEDITDYKFTLTFDSTALAYASISSPDGAASSDIFTSLGENSVTVLYNGSDAVKSGEVCRIAFKALDGAADGEYEIEAGGAVVITQSAYSEVSASNGKVTLLTPDIKVSADAVFTDPDGNEVDSADMSGDIDASLTIDEVEGTDGDTPIIANIILAVYDRSGALASMTITDADLSDTSFVFQKTISIPENVSVGSIKLMIWNRLGDMSPITAASKML